MEELIAELETGSEETEELLCRLTEADEKGRHADILMSLGEALRGFLEHDPEHLAQLRTALETQTICPHAGSRTRCGCTR